MEKKSLNSYKPMARLNKLLKSSDRSLDLFDRVVVILEQAAGSRSPVSKQGGKSPKATSSTKSYPLGSESGQGFHPDLEWSHYVLNQDNQQIFASRYKLELPDETQLAAEIKRELDLIQEKE